MAKRGKWRRVGFWSAWAVVAVALGVGTTVLVSWQYAVRFPSRTGWIPISALENFSVKFLDSDYLGAAAQGRGFAMFDLQLVRSELYTSELQEKYIANWPPVGAERIPGWVYWPDDDFAFQRVAPESLFGRPYASFAYGWPRVAMRGLVIESYPGVSGMTPPEYQQMREFVDFYVEQNLTLPVGIIPRGFAINTGFYGAVWYVVGGVGAWVLKRFWNRRVARAG